MTENRQQRTRVKILVLCHRHKTSKLSRQKACRRWNSGINGEPTEPLRTGTSLVVVLFQCLTAPDVDCSVFLTVDAERELGSSPWGYQQTPLLCERTSNLRKRSWLKSMASTMTENSDCEKEG